MKGFKSQTYAEISLQFYRDRKGTPQFMITCNPPKDGEDLHTGVDAHIFAKALVDSIINQKNVCTNT